MSIRAVKSGLSNFSLMQTWASGRFAPRGRFTCPVLAAFGERETINQTGEFTRPRARPKVASSMSTVNRPVKVFCWLGW